MSIGIVAVKPLRKARGAKAVAAWAGSDSVKQEFVANLTCEHVLEPNAWIADAAENADINWARISHRRRRDHELTLWGSINL